MTPTQRASIEQAISVLVLISAASGEIEFMEQAISGLRAALAEPETVQEPVAKNCMPHGWVVNWPHPDGGTKPVYRPSSIQPKFGYNMNPTMYPVYTEPSTPLQEPCPLCGDSSAETASDSDMSIYRSAARHFKEPAPVQGPSLISYDPHKDEFTVYGKRYAARLFNLLLQVGSVLKVVEGPDDVVTLERVEAQQPTLVNHPDHFAVGMFATAMKAKMTKQRARGYGGWQDLDACPTKRLQRLLVEHISKGDPVDVGNFAMMLWARGEPTAAESAPVQEPVARFNWSQGGFEWLTKYDFEKHNMQPLYLAQPRKAVKLSDEDIEQIAAEYSNEFGIEGKHRNEFTRATEAAVLKANGVVE